MDIVHDKGFRCPKCQTELLQRNENFECGSCKSLYLIEDGIARMFVANDWSEDKPDISFEMKAFYEETPFPNYDDFDDVSSLITKARKGIFAKVLDDQIPFNSRIIECGCGTGQLSNFLSVSSRKVYGTDMCMNSLKLANAFKEENNLNNVEFVQMNLFRPCFKEQSFDIVISNGVLHHTSNAELAFKSIARLVKPGGYIIIGLYHTYGRLATDIRRLLFSLTRDRFKFLDKHLNDRRLSDAKREAWFKDQYKNPHETKHTVSELMKWFDNYGFSFINSLPLPRPYEVFTEDYDLFERREKPSYIERVIRNLSLIFKGHLEGGFFTMIGRKL